MVLLLFMTFKTKLRSVCSSAAVKERIASDHTSILATSSLNKTQVNLCEKNKRYCSYEDCNNNERYFYLLIMVCPNRHCI